MLTNKRHWYFRIIYIFVTVSVPFFFPFFIIRLKLKWFKQINFLQQNWQQDMISYWNLATLCLCRADTGTTWNTSRAGLP